MGIFSRRRYDPNDSEYEAGSAWWSVSCKSDPRFNASGSCSSVTGAALAADDHIKKRISQLGLKEDEVPEDIEYSGGKP
jgi:hypothetical protein